MAVADAACVSLLVLVIAVVTTAIVTAVITVAIMRRRRPRVSIVSPFDARSPLPYAPAIRQGSPSVYPPPYAPVYPPPHHLPVPVPVPPQSSMYPRAGTQPGTGLVRPGEVSSHPYMAPVNEAPAPDLAQRLEPIPDETPTVPAPPGWPAKILEAKTVPSSAPFAAPVTPIASPVAAPIDAVAAAPRFADDRIPDEAPTTRAPPSHALLVAARTPRSAAAQPVAAQASRPAAPPVAAQSYRPAAAPVAAQAPRPAPASPARTRMPKPSPQPVAPSSATPTKRHPRPGTDDAIDAPTWQDTPAFVPAPPGAAPRPLVRIPDASAALAPQPPRAESPRWETGEYTAPDELVPLGSGGDFRVTAPDGVGELDIVPRDPEIEVASMRNALNELSLEEHLHDPPTGVRRSRS